MNPYTAEFVALYDQQLAEAEEELIYLANMWIESGKEIGDIPEHIRMIGLCSSITNNMDHTETCELLTVAVRMIARLLTRNF